MNEKVKNLIPKWIQRMEAYYVIATDLEGRYTFVNDLFEKRFAYLGIDLIGQPFSITIHPEDLESAKQAAYSCIKEPQETVTIKVRKPVEIPGEYYWTQWELSLLHDMQGKPVGIVCLGNDITDSKNRVKEDEELASLFKDIGSNVPGMIYQFRAEPDGSYRIPYISGGIRRYFGLTPEDVRESAKAAFDLIHPEDLPKVYNSIALSAQNQEAWHCIFRVNLKGGEQIWLEGKATPKTDVDGNLIWNGFLNDITERQEHLKQLEVSEKRLQSLLDLQTCYVLRLDMQGNYTYANQKYLDVFGYLYRTENNGYHYLGLDSVDAILPEDVPKAAEAMEKLEKQPDKVVQADLRKPLENGTIAYTLWDFSFVFDSNGQPVEIQCVGIDYTERQKKEEELLESQYKLNAVQNSTRDGNVLISNDYKILSFNEAAQKNTIMVFGKPLREQDSILDFVLPETEEVFLKDSREALNGNFARREFKVINYWFEFTFFPVYDYEKNLIGFSMNSRLIDERKKQEEALRKAKKEAEAANKTKSDFLANMSHELRTPLNGVIGFTEILSETSLTPVQQQYVKNANISGHNLLKIINDILNLSKIEAGMFELDMVRTDIIELIQNCMNVVKVAADRKQLELQIRVDPDLPRFVVTDPLRLTQILSNLLNNAIKFTEAGEVELNVEYRALDVNRGQILFSVRDTGVGISEEQRQYLFKAFSQADSSTTRRFGGTGLGLAISQMIAEKFGSYIEFESIPGKGSRFYFELDAVTEMKPSEKGPSPDQEPSAHPKVADNSSTILVAEDVALNMNLIIALLGSILPEAELLKAEDGKEAVAIYKSRKPDLVLMDVQMPKMDGLEATRAIRELERQTGDHTPIVALTAAAMKEDRQKCLDGGMDEVITKPIDVHKLKLVIKKI